MTSYKILNLEENASLDDVKKAYRKLSKIHHPDMGGDANKFTIITKAYESIISGEYTRNNTILNGTGVGVKIKEKVYEDALGKDDLSRYKSNESKLNNFMKRKGGH